MSRRGGAGASGCWRTGLLGASLDRAFERSLGGLLQQVNAQLVGHQQLRLRVVARDPWSNENGGLTSPMTFKHSRIEGQAGNRLDGWYGHRAGGLGLMGWV